MTIHAHFSGNVGKDARFGTVGDKTVCNFNVGVKEGYGDKERTNWIDCALWGKTAEKMSTMLLKGTKVTVHGRITDVRHDQKDGKHYIAMRCIVNELDLHGKKDERHNEAPCPVLTGTSAAVDLEEIPF